MLSDIAKIISKTKVKLLIFGYVIAVIGAIMYIKFQSKLHVSLKDTVHLHSYLTK